MTCTAAVDSECRYFINWPDFWKMCLQPWNLFCNYNLCNKILVSMVMRSAFLTYLGIKKKKKNEEMTISLRKMKFSVSFHSWTASCRLVNRLVAFCPFYTWKNWVINNPQAFLARRRFNELCSSTEAEGHKWFFRVHAEEQHWWKNGPALLLTGSIKCH